MLGRMVAVDTRESRGEDARRRLVAAALELLGAGGAEAVSAREVGDLAAVSASAVNYHFGGRDGLLQAAMEAAAATSRAWRATSLVVTPPHIPAAALPGWVAAHVQDLCNEREVPATALRELRLLAGRWSEPPSAATRDQRDADDFWTEIAGRSDLPPAAGPVLSDFSVGALSIHGRASDWRRELPWLLEACARLVARLSGQRRRLPGWDGWRAAAASRAQTAARDTTAKVGPASPAAERMLNAAADIVGRGGAASLTHRAVASQANASLANVTHHFPTRAMLLRRTFQHVYDRVRSTGPRALDTSPIEIPALCAEMAEALVTETGDVNPGVLALHELMLASVRDPQLRAEVEELRANRGEGAGAAISRLTGAAEPPDRMDAYATSTMMLGVILAAIAAPRAERREALRTRLQGHFEALYG